MYTHEKDGQRPIQQPHRRTHAAFASQQPFSCEKRGTSQQASCCCPACSTLMQEERPRAVLVAPLKVHSRHPAELQLNQLSAYCRVLKALHNVTQALQGMATCGTCVLSTRQQFSGCC